MPRAVVLGAGMVGAVIAADLAADSAFDITIADRSESALGKAAARCKGRAKTTVADCSDPATIRRLAKGADIVLGALASHLGYRALEAVIGAGAQYSDIGEMALLMSCAMPLAICPSARSRSCCITVCWVWRRSW